jgi:hypothetical protein
VQTHYDLLDIVRTDLTLLGFPPAAYRALNEHETAYRAKDGVYQDGRGPSWFNAAANYLGATEAALKCKLEACSYVMLDSSMDPCIKKTALDILLDPNDAMALQHGIAVVIKHGLLSVDTYAEKLAKVCSSPMLSHLSLSLKGFGLRGPVPPVLLQICAEAEFFDLSGNFDFDVSKCKDGFGKTIKQGSGNSSSGDESGGSSSSDSSDSSDEDEGGAGVRTFMLHLVEHVHNIKLADLVDMRSQDLLVDLDGMQYYRNVQTCKFGECVKLMDVSALGGCTALTDLDLHECELVEDISALGECTALTSLDLSNCDSIESIAALGKLVRLTTLMLHESKSIDSISALQTCSALTTLDMHGCAAVRSINSLRGCADLTDLNLSSCSKDLKDIEPIASLTSLTRLQLWAAHGVKDLAAIGKLTALASLQLGRCKRINDISPLRSCIGLTELQLEDCKGIRSLSALGSCTALARLNLRGCDGITDLSVLEACIGLVDLDLGGSRRRLSGVSAEQVRKAMMQTQEAQERETAQHGE